MKPLGIALLGCGVVGSGVVRLLTEQRERLERRAGRVLHLHKVVVRDVEKERLVKVPAELISTDFEEVFRNPHIDVVVELMGGVEPARTHMLRSFAMKKHVITANKAVLATHGDELFAAAHAAGCTLSMEASVGGGIPIVHALTQGLAANQVTAIKAILNGTTNFILAAMSDRHLSYDDALREAQRLGYAEADPTLDVSGMDSAQKLAVLARICFGVSIQGDAIERRGIQKIDLLDIHYAREMGYVIKLIAEAWMSEHRVALHVEPTLVSRFDPLAQMPGAYNAIEVIGDMVKDSLLCGPGAGQMPTASAVVADIIDVALGHASIAFNSMKLWETDRGIGLRSPSEIESRFYIRVNAEEQPGSLAQITGILGREKISVASIVQHEQLETQRGLAVPIVISTHATNLGSIRKAIHAIDTLECSLAPSIYMPIAE
jgi:homoserine dehydrogenase